MDLSSMFGELPPDLKQMMAQISVIAAAPDEESRNKQYEELNAMLAKSEAVDAVAKSEEEALSAKMAKTTTDDTSTAAK